MKVFNTHLEFNRSELYRVIDHRLAENKAGYVCICDSSVISRVQTNEEYRSIINNAFINSCDGSSICMLAKKIHGGNLESVNGPEIFSKYIKIPYKQVILGNTDDIVQMVRNKLRSENVDDSHIVHMSLPFCDVNDFEYENIANEINKYNYDIIWVSLGNPKQEIFMSKLLPFLHKGVMFGIGAALNFWTGALSLPEFHIGPLRFIWLTRLFEDPKRQFKNNWQIIKTIPKMYIEEVKRQEQIVNHVK